MGQQQLLLLIIGIIIVGLATLAGLTALQEHFRKDEADGLLERGIAIASHAVHWKTLNDPFAGGSQSYERLGESGLQMLALDDTTVRGRYAITAATPTTLEITGVSDRYPGIGIRVFVEGYGIDNSDIAFDGSITLE
jgi:hypothetical protein